MELINHIGLVSESELDVKSIVSRIRGLVILLVLFVAAILYKFVSISCLGLNYLLPESISNFKRISASMFWELCFYFLDLNEVNFVISGDEINTDSAVVISNHNSLADFIAVAYLARYTNNKITHIDKERHQTFKNITLPRINFFSWFKLWRVPSLGVLINLAKCDENWELENSLSRIVFGKIMRTKVPEWIVLFPEVNIWTEEDSSLQNIQSEKFYLPKLNNLLYPRFSAFYNVISTLNNKEHSKFTQLYDLSILYETRLTKTNKLQCWLSNNTNIPIKSSDITNPDNEMHVFSPSLLEIFSSVYPITININVKTKRLLRIPTKRSKMEKWLENTWVEKDKFIDQIKTNLSKTTATTTTFSIANDLNVHNSSPLKTGLFKLSSIKL